MNLNEDVVYGCLRLGLLHELHPGRSRGLVRHHDCLHHLPPDVWDVAIFRIPLQMSENRTAKIDGPMTFCYGIDATGSACKNQRCGTNICFSRQRAGRHNDDRPLGTVGLEKISTKGDSFLISPFDPPGDAYCFACSAAEIIVES
jgi:hypothetical protein